MKILLHGGEAEDKNRGLLVGSFLRSFEMLGHEVVFFPVTEFYNKKLASFGNRYLRGLVHRMFWRLLCRGLNKRFLKLIAESKPDLVFICKGWHVSPETLLSIKKLWPDTPLFCFNQENPFNLWNFSYSNSWIVKSIPLYDVYFSWGRFLIDKIRAAGAKQVELLPFAYDPEFSRPSTLNGEERNFYGSDIAFIGTWDNERESWLKHLTAFDLKIWGSGWSHASKEVSAKWQNFSEDFSKVCGAARIVIDILRRQMQPSHSMKTFEIPACRGFLMCNYGGELYDFFEEGKEIVTFRDPEDMVKKAKFYLERDDLRRKIVEAAYEKVQPHSYVERAKRVIAVYESFIALRE